MISIGEIGVQASGLVAVFLIAALFILALKVLRRKSDDQRKPMINVTHEHEAEADNARRLTITTSAPEENAQALATPEKVGSSTASGS